MWWFIKLTVGILLFSLWIDCRRKKRRNDKHTMSIDPSINKGKVGSDWNSGDGPAGF
ncbi:hypothetical protein [Cytobacillus solani]|uniref:hypothetical protein n=1 Tax=Cytobacillus solani TaxID=1637975 RepID=UPI000A8D1CBC|nr:hypothetical protein [Cytobacillus solani]